MSEINQAATEYASEIEAEIPADTEADAPEETTPEIDPIEDLYHGDCPSISGRSILTFAVGRHKETGELHLRVLCNTGKGMLFDGWASAKDIDAIVKGATELTAKSFHALHPGKSINTGGFVMAVLKDLGLIRANEENTRLHEHVPATTFEKVAMARMGKTIEAAPVTKPVKRKAKGA
ncbi:MAG: hypothetical protein IPH15_13040 [Comamonadaceae bacterium]|nr:hypothetical protein [Comamonadaceae bacterium]